MSDLQKITTEQMDAVGVVSAPDVLNGTTAENKGVFDKMARELIVPEHNKVVEKVNGLKKSVQYGSEDVKFLRLNADRVLEVSTDGSVWQATGSGGHIIVDAAGTVLPQRGRMQFAEGTVEDDGTQTVVHGVKGDTGPQGLQGPVSYTHIRAHETLSDLLCRLLRA